LNQVQKTTVIIGGGTFSHIRNHLSLAAPAFGSTAKLLQYLIPNSKLVLTKMADGSSKLVTNEDIIEYIDGLLKLESTGTIIFNVAMCDFSGTIGNIDSGSHAERLETKNGIVDVILTPAEKYIQSIRVARPDIFLVGFKTTTGKTSDEQFKIALNFMKRTKCNLVLANDTVTRNNMVIVPEETSYFETIDRDQVLRDLANIILLRQNLTYHRTTLIKNKNTSINYYPTIFNRVLLYLIHNKAFKIINGCKFTPGHFCYKYNDNTYISSQRKADHNKIYENGLTKVTIKHDKIIAIGTKKPSVGFTSQKLLFDKYPKFNCIIHTHNPLKKNSQIPVASQLSYQCGSIECGQNTAKNIKPKYKESAYGKQSA